MKAAVAASATILVLSLASCANLSAYELPRAAPELSGADLSGEPRSLDELEGKVVLVAVWASWCSPCRDEAPLIEQALTRFEDDGFAVLGINFRDGAPSARAFADEVDMTFPSVSDLSGATAVDWGITGLPQSFLIDREGRIIAQTLGPLTESWIDDNLPPALD